MTREYIFIKGYKVDISTLWDDISAESYDDINKYIEEIFPKHIYLSGSNQSCVDIPTHQLPCILVIHKAMN